MLIIDGDCAFMLGAMERDRDLTLSLEEIRAAPPSGRSCEPSHLTQAQHIHLVLIFVGRRSLFQLPR